MKMKKICIVLLLGTIVLTGCSHEDNKVIIDTNSDSNQNGDTLSKQDVTDSQDENGEVYYCDIVNDSVSKYPELNTTDVVIDEYGFGPMIVSPYANDDVIKAVTHVICDTNITTVCYGNYLFDEYHDDFSKYAFEEVYEIIQSRVNDARLQADLFNEKLVASIESDSEINISPDGEYYYILDMDNFEESANAIQDSVDRQSDIFGYEMQDHSGSYFTHEGRTFTGGYRGPTYAIYLDTYSPDNKIYEYYYWKAKNEWVDIYSDLYTSLIYDYTAINEKLNEQTDYRTSLTCSSGIYQNINTGDTGLNSIDFTYRMGTEEFEPTEAIELAYEVYTNVCRANDENNTHKIYVMCLYITNFTEYEKEYNKVRVFIPFEEEYSFEEFEKIVMDNVVTAIDPEPV